MRKLKYTLLLSTTITAAPALAADGDIPPVAAQARVSADTIIVTATRTPQEAWKSGQSVSVIDRQEIEDSQDVSATDLLRRVPGVAISRNGGLGNVSSVFLRGANGEQSLVLIDGVRVGDPSSTGGGFDFGSLLAGPFDSVEVVRGAQSVIWGSRALGGVINFRTREPGGEWTGRASAEYGARDRIEVAGAASGTLGPVGLSFGADYLDTDGYSALSEDRGFKERDGFEGVNLFGKAEVTVAKGLSLNVGGFYSKNDYEYDDSFTPADAPYFGKKRDLTGFAFAEYQNGIVDGRVGYTITDIDRSTNYGTGSAAFDARRELIEGVVSVKPTENINVTVGAESEDLKFSNDSESIYSAPSGYGDKTSIDSVFGQLQFSPVEGLWLNGGVRYDDHEAYGSETLFSASGAYRLPSGVLFRASYGEGFKAPSLYQIAYNATQATNPVASIKPEQAKSYDAGVELPFSDRQGTFSATYFHRKTRDLIDYGYPVGYFNVGRATAEGLELAMGYETDKFDVRFSYTYLETEDKSTGLDLVRRPNHNLFLGISYRPVEALLLGVDLTHGGTRADVFGGARRRIDGYDTVDLRASYDLTENFAVYGRVDNVTDAEYELATYYGQPGRNATVGVRARF